MRHYEIRIVVEARDKDEARAFAETIGAGSGQQWDKPLIVCGPIGIEPSVDPALLEEAGSMSTSDGLGA